MVNLMERLLLRPNEVAEILGICRTRAYDLINSGAIPAIRLGKSLRVPAESLRVWIGQQTDDAARVALEARERAR